MVVKTKKDLQKALSEAGLPSSYNSILGYEKSGLISRGGTEIKVASRDRFYTQQEIQEIVNRIKNK